MSNEPFIILGADYHRNGVSGTGFFIGLVELTQHSDKADYVGEVFQIIAVPSEDDGGVLPSFYGPNGSADIFVTSVSATAKGSVGFGPASFRGDHFIAEATAIVRQVRNR